MSMRVLLIFGTRPEAIKVAPVIRALQQDDRFTPIVAVSAQHREMLDQVLSLFAIVPDFDLNIIRPGQTLTDVTASVLRGLEHVFEATDPHVVVVQGDTTTTFSGALAAFYRQVPVVHMEAGLRTNDRYSPFPEELNRRLTTRLANLHLAATASGRANLVAEGIDDQSVVLTGNTVIDALHWTAGQNSSYGDTRLEAIDASPARIVTVTAHRRESWGSGLAEVGDALAEIARRFPNVHVVFPIHRNPLVRDAIIPAVAGLPNVTVVEPLAYAPFARLLQRSTLVLTDSGGVQEEAPSLGKPVLVLRESTERPEGIAAGTAMLVGTDRQRIVSAVSRLLTDPSAYAAMANATNPYGDGFAAPRTVEAIAFLLGAGPRPQDFATH